MRWALAVIVALLLAACGVGTSGSGHISIGGSAVRAAQAALDAETILQGMAQARAANAQVAGEMDHPAPGVGGPAVTR